MSGIRSAILSSAQRRAVDVTAQIRADLAKLAPGIEGRVLDIGCGMKPYRDLFTHASSYIGVDLPRERSANQLPKSVQAACDISRLPFADACFDSALCTQVLEHVPDPAAVVREAARVLRPGGMFLITIPFHAAEHEEPHDYFRFTQYGIRSLLAAAGFEDIEVRKQFGFWSSVGEMIYWHFHRKVRGTRLEAIWYAFGAIVFLRAFHFLNRLDPDEKVALNLCVRAVRRRARPSVAEGRFGAAAAA